MNDVINHPLHYRGKTGLEAWDVIEDFALTYNCGVAVAYVLRAERKGKPIEDLRKAVAHLGREIEQRTGAGKQILQPSNAPDLTISARIKRELKRRGCLCVDGTYVSGSTDAVVHSVLAALEAAP